MIFWYTVFSSRAASYGTIFRFYGIVRYGIQDLGAQTKDESTVGSTKTRCYIAGKKSSDDENHRPGVVGMISMKHSNFPGDSHDAGSEEKTISTMSLCVMSCL